MFFIINLLNYKHYTMQTAERAAARRCHNNGNTTMKDLNVYDIISTCQLNLKIVLVVTWKCFFLATIFFHAWLTCDILKIITILVSYGMLELPFRLNLAWYITWMLLEYHLIWLASSSTDYQAIKSILSRIQVGF